MPQAGNRSRNTIPVHYLGPPASFSHQASLNAFQHNQNQSESTSTSTSPSFVPQPSFAEIFTAVQSSSLSPQHPSRPNAHPVETSATATTTYGVVPFENSSNGSVVQLLDLLADHEDTYPDVTVCGEYYLPVHHCLLVQPRTPLASKQRPPNHDSHTPNTHINATKPPPTFDLSRITQILTHPQVWGQCTSFLSHPTLKSAERIDVGSTSLAAKKVAAQQQQQPYGEKGVTAAIASSLAAEVNGLEVVAENIEDRGDNTTRFFILRNGRAGDGFKVGNEDEGRSKQKSLLSFTIDHASPGSLADTLAVFGTYGFNLTSIYTRPSRLRPWHYIFFVECARGGGQEGDRDAGEDGGNNGNDERRERKGWDDGVGGGVGKTRYAVEGLGNVEGWRVAWGRSSWEKCSG